MKPGNDVLGTRSRNKESGIRSGNEAKESG